jgi:hypothetical protein
MSTQKLPTRTLAGVTVPSTTLINKALELAEKSLDPIGYRHVVRSWLIGALIISRLPPAQREGVDLEAFSVAAILHDLGWSRNPEMRSNDKIFEVDGANAARDFILREGDAARWDKHRIQLVWDSIALHTFTYIAAHKEPEVALTHAGISVELFGTEVVKSFGGGDLLPVSDAELGKIAAEFPRTGLVEHIKGLMCGYCMEKPQVTYNTWVQGFGDRFVEGYGSEGKQIVDLMMNKIEEY